METADVPDRPPDQGPMYMVLWKKLGAYAKILAPEQQDAEDLTSEAECEESRLGVPHERIYLLGAEGCSARTSSAGSYAAIRRAT
jgi:hypothetical protein